MQHELAHTELKAIVERVTAVFNNARKHEQLLCYRDAQAQQLLDLFQWLLDNNNLWIDPEFISHLVVTTQRLSTSSTRLPTRYNLCETEIVEEGLITSGSYANVYKGFFHGRLVCMKVMRKPAKTSLVAFAAEAILAGQLVHPNIQPIYGICTLKRQPCLVSPWMENRDVNRFLDRHPDANRLLLVLDIAKGLAHLHVNNIIHGDLKGANILVDDTGRACIADFGLSSISEVEISHQTTESTKGVSIRWQAPELFQIINEDVAHNSKASDIYALSSTFYEVLTGETPFHEIHRDASVIQNIKHGIRPSRPPDSCLCWARWGLTEFLWSLMEACWNQEPQRRPSIHSITNKLASKTPTDDRPPGVHGFLPPLPSSHLAPCGLPELLSANRLDALLDENVVDGKSEEAQLTSDNSKTNATLTTNESDSTFRDDFSVPDSPRWRRRTTHEGQDPSNKIELRPVETEVVNTHPQVNQNSAASRPSHPRKSITTRQRGRTQSRLSGRKHGDDGKIESRASQYTSTVETVPPLEPAVTPAPDQSGKKTENQPDPVSPMGRKGLDDGKIGSGASHYTSTVPPLEPVVTPAADEWSKKDDLHLDPESHKVIDRKVKCLLNKLTMENFDSISSQIVEWANKSESESDGRALIQVTNLVFDKAIDEAAQWSEMYGRLCKKMMESTSPQVRDDSIRNSEGQPACGGQLFLRHLLNRCQGDFDRWIDNVGSAGKAELLTDEYYAAEKAKRQGFGIMKLIGELLKLQMLTERIVHVCVRKLFWNIEHSEDKVVGLCELLKAVGGCLGAHDAQMNTYLTRIKELIMSSALSPRAKILLQNLIEKGWISRKRASSNTLQKSQADPSNFGKINKVSAVKSGSGKVPPSKDSRRKSASSNSGASSNLKLRSGVQQAAEDAAHWRRGAT